MRTRRIAIRCRRTGRSATVAIGTTGTGAPVDLPVPERPPGLAVPPGYESMPPLDLPSLYGTPVAEAPANHHPALGPDHIAPRLAVPAYLSDPAHAPAEADAHALAEADAHAPAEADAHAPAGSARGYVNPWRNNRGPELTLADVVGRPYRRDLDWNRNPGWPAGIGWSHIARVARGRSPRHARADGWRVSGHAVAWTGVGMLAAAILMLVADLLR
jgi:hypothetical protein